MLNYYDLLKAAETGLISPNMSDYDRLRAAAIRESIKKAKQQSNKAGADQGDGAQLDDLTKP